MRQRASNRRQHTTARRGTRSRRPTLRSAPRGVRPRAKAQAQVQGLLDNLSEALTIGDGPAAAACFEDPAIMVMENGNQLLDDRDEVAGFFGSAFQQYNEQGVFDTFAEIDDIDWLTPELAVVKTHWPYLDENGKETGEGETSAYVVRLKPRGEAIIAAAVTLGTDSGKDFGQSSTSPYARRKSAGAGSPSRRLY